MHWSDSNDTKRTLLLQSVLVMNIFSSLVSHALGYSRNAYLKRPRRTHQVPPRRHGTCVSSRAMAMYGVFFLLLFHSPFFCFFFVARHSNASIVVMMRSDVMEATKNIRMFDVFWFFFFSLDFFFFLVCWPIHSIASHFVHAEPSLAPNFEKNQRPPRFRT
jgi:hypothetical protein